MVGAAWSSAVGSAFLLGAVVGVSFFAEWPIFVRTYAAIYVVLVVRSIVRAWVRWKYTSWRLDDIGLHVRRGRWWRSEELVPRTRVQHLDIDRGPLERRFGLASLTVHTAGSALSAVGLSGLFDADAVALRDALVPPDDNRDDAV